MGRICLALLAVLLLAAGCVSEPRPSAIFDGRTNEPYTLSAGDRLRVIVFGQDTLSNSYAVDGSGHISMPLIGIVNAQGVTTRDLEGEIAAKLRAGYIRDPKVSVEVEAYRPFFVLGEVNASGQFPYINGMTVQTAVAVAGGFTPRAQQNSATITRVIAGKILSAQVPITQPVKPGDTITIGERFF